MPSTWFQNEIAVIDWLQGFMNRHKEMSIHCPEATSISKSTNFNNSKVQQLQDNLKEVFHAYKTGPNNIYNCDETTPTTFLALSASCQESW